MLKLEYYDYNHVVDEAESGIDPAEKERLLTCIQKGEERYRDSLGWLEPEEWAGDEVLKELKLLAETVRAQADILVVIGIGGSNQAARAVIEALPKNGSLTVLYAGNNLSPYTMNEVLKELEGKSVYINVIAKNFETLEPGVGFRILRQYLETRYGNQASRRIIVTGTRGSHLHDLCIAHGYRFLEFPDTIGGRYSGLSSVSLFPIAAAGLAIDEMVRGASDMRKELTVRAPGDHGVFRYAVLRNLLYRKGYRMEMLASFDPRFQHFNGWWTQLFAESEGKEGKGLYPVSAVYSEDLHSIGQFVQEGTPVLFETFLEVERQDSSILIKADQVEDQFSYLDGMDLGQISQSAFAATLKAHSQRMPCFKITVDKLNEYSFGQLFYFFEAACYLSGSMLGVNPFDQPGVEDYKAYMFKALGKQIL